MSPLSIAQVCADHGIAPGSTKGAAQHLRGIAAGLSAQGHSVTTYSARKQQGSFPAPVHDLDDLYTSDLTDMDVIYERYSLGHRNGLDLARSIGAGFVLEVNAPLVAEARSHRPHTVRPDHVEIEQALLAEADLVITVSSELTRWVNLTRSARTITIPNGFEPSWFAKPAVSTNATLAFIGHPKPWHGADRLPALLKTLAARGQFPSLILIGGGPGTDEVTTHASNLGVGHQITVTGPLAPEQASSVLTQATIGIAPYRRQEPFYFCPLKIIDYLAAGLPVVSTAQGDIDDLVGDAGVLVDPDSDQELADAVSYLLANPGEASRLGKSGRVRAHASMTWGHAAAKTAAAIATLGKRSVSA